MKRLYLLLIFGSIISVSFGQVSFSFPNDSGAPIYAPTGSGTNCPSNAIFNQPPVNFNNAMQSDEGIVDSHQWKSAENFSGLTEEIGGITFWGVMSDGQTTNCYTPGPQDFRIEFFQDQNSSIGALVQTFNVTVTPVETGDTILATLPVLRYDVTFPSSFSLSNGWVLVYKKNPTNYPCVFSWLNTAQGDSKFAASLNGSPMMYFTFGNLAFCLTGTSSVPLADWALAFSLLLISGFIIVRYRMKRA